MGIAYRLERARVVDRGDLALAAARLERAFQVKQQWLGDDHPSTRLTLGNLARAQPERT